MTTKEQGIYGESRVLTKFVELGIPVSIPFGDNYSYDLVAEFGGKLQKIQVKTSTQSTDHYTKFRMRKVRINRNRSIIKQYTSDEVDYYALYSVPRDRIFLVKSDMVGDSITLWFNSAPCLANKKFNLEEDYLIDRVVNTLP